ncbi:glycosyltransferase family 4 protein [Desulfonatronovibrio magnus]|uniref:glycosyltransferase family 4 protein n=1 Tax=Desulfonatronovibrio magnus TaxID=698827 RepID=UPI0005EBF2C3|nr:glycosyltransferase family 4 protein [Desulfonatronovibrio magnus]
MNILFVHQNFPGQYLHLAPALASYPENRVVAISARQGVKIPGVKILVYKISKNPSPTIHPWIAEQEVKVIRGEAAASAAMRLRSQGFAPDVICAHPGWGEALFLRDVWPDSKIVCFCEFYYQSSGSDVGFDPEFSRGRNQDELCRLRMKNAHNLISLEAADRGISPTIWQRGQYPVEYQSRIEVIFDGINTARVCPKDDAFIMLQRHQVKLTKSDEIITFVARNLEPYRGIHIFLRALPEILKKRPQARAVILGGDEVSYGRKPPPGKTFRSMLLEEVSDDLDMDRVHFVGRVPYNIFMDVLRISSAHVYLTYPFVLSWSMLEAMSAGCIVIGSDTAPVREVIEHQHNGLLVDFFDVKGLAGIVIDVLGNRKKYAHIKMAARKTIVERYDLKNICLPAQLKMIESLTHKA